tara:strand:+ start:35 stop:760 length:726 start_codon:yes stop_codon:yes gene_type:complete
MKKLITLALIIGATTFTQAQSNLVFNQVILLELSNGSETTVPEGKVWKVTYGQGGNIFKVNGENWNVGVLGSHKNTPIWFPAESVFTKYIGSNSINVLNILEFNVVAISSSSGGSGGGVSADGLVFSGIINQFIPTSSVTGIGTVAGSFTVPEGKIWKISTMSHKKIAGSGDIIAFNGNLYVGMDGVPIYAISSSINVNSAITNNVILTPGTYELKWYASNGANHYCGTNTHLVAIEYNTP